MYYVYILYSYTTLKYYVGQTNDFQNRLERHNLGMVKSTKSGCPWKRIHVIECDSRSEALKLEMKVKNRGIRRFLLDNNIEV